MKLNIDLSNWSENALQRKCYTFDDLPMMVWVKIQETADLTLLYRNGGKLCKGLGPIWIKIFNQFCEEIGLSDEYKTHLKMVQRRGFLQLESILNPSPIVNAERLIIEAEFEEQAKQKRDSIYEAAAKLSVHYRFHIDLNTLTVKQYYSYLKVGR